MQLQINLFGRFDSSRSPGCLNFFDPGVATKVKKKQGDGGEERALLGVRSEKPEMCEETRKGCRPHGSARASESIKIAGGE
jgi:hypothetical protein